MKRFQDKKQEQLKKDNKGFSLVELIIVIAIMAILVGIVGTQVIPYLNRSREAKDLQIVNSFSTAAVTGYSQNAELFKDKEADKETVTITFKNTVPGGDPEKTWYENVQQLTGYTDITAAKAAMTSSNAKNIDSIEIVLNFNARTLTVQAKDSEGNPILDDVTSQI